MNYYILIIMKKIITVLTIILISNLAFAKTVKSPLDDLSKNFKNSKLIKISSYTPSYQNSFISIKNGSYKNSPIKIDALISYPQEGNSPFPLVVFSHSSLGPETFTDSRYEFDMRMAKKLLKKGIAIMFVDNNTARIKERPFSVYANYIDTFMSLEHLSKDPKINVKKVGITGWSNGGNNSTIVSEKRMRDALINKNLYYAAALPRNVDCHGAGFFKNPQIIKKTKTLMVNGDQDDVNELFHCINYVDRLSSRGANIDLLTIRGGHHGFTGNFFPEYNSEVKNYSNCPAWHLLDDGRPNLAIGRETCVKLGATYGGNKGNEFEKVFLKFFEQTLLSLVGPVEKNWKFYSD